MNLFDYFEDKAFLFLEGGKTEPTEIIASAVLKSDSGIENKKQFSEKEISSIAKKLNSEKISGFSGSVNKFIESKPLDFLLSISMANKIKEILGNKKIKEIIYTGQTGFNHDVIKHLNISTPGFKDYNPSDIVVKTADGKFYGFSLKKNTPNSPTVINRSVTGFLNLTSIDKEKIAEMEKHKSNYIGEAFGLKNASHEQVTAAIKKIDEKYEKNKKLSGKGSESRPSQEKIGNHLKSEGNYYFKTINNIIHNHEDEILKSFIEDVFRSKLSSFDNLKDFDIYVVSGNAKEINKKTGVGEVLPGEAYHLKNSSKLMIQKFKNKKIGIIDDKDNLHAFEKGATSAKLHYIITLDSKPFIKVDIRFKGDYKSNPQFQAFPLPYFKKLLNV